MDAQTCRQEGNHIWQPVMQWAAKVCFNSVPLKHGSISGVHILLPSFHWRSHPPLQTTGKAWLLS
jgi:hypothetical protein